MKVTYFQVRLVNNNGQSWVWGTGQFTIVFALKIETGRGEEQQWRDRKWSKWKGEETREEDDSEEHRHHLVCVHASLHGVPIHGQFTVFNQQSKKFFFKNTQMPSKAADMFNVKLRCQFILFSKIIMFLNI